MKAESAASCRSRQAFYTYRRRPSASPSVCSSASSSVASASASRSTRPSTRKRLATSPKSAPLPPSSNYLAVEHASSHVAPKPARPSVGSSKDLEQLLEPEYSEEILEYMRDMEEQTRASVELIDQQPELQWYMRPYLIDFLIEIHSQYRLRPETLYLAVNIADRYTAKRVVYKRHYQLVGCAALWIAAKFEDAKDRIPTVQDLCAMTCHAYEASAFIQMEGHVLSTLNWNLGHPTAEAWLRAQSLFDPSLLTSDSRLQHVARFLMELTLFHRAFVPIKSSEVALGCLLLAKFLLGKARRTEDETTITIQIAQMLDGHLAEHLEQLSAILIRKYTTTHFSHAATFIRESYLSGRRFDLDAWPSPFSPLALSGTLSPMAFELRRDSSISSFASSDASSPRSYTGHSTDDDEMPLTPCTPLTIWGVDPANCYRPSPLAMTETCHVERQHLVKQGPPPTTAQVQNSVHRQDSTPAMAVSQLQVKLVPTSGPAKTLC